MATWAFECTRCGDPDSKYFVSQAAVAEFPTQTTIVKVKVGQQWLCAQLDRRQVVEVEGMLVREVVPTNARSCEECRDE